MTLSLPRLPLQLTASLGHDGLAVLDAVPAAPAPCPATGCGFVLCCQPHSCACPCPQGWEGCACFCLSLWGSRPSLSCAQLSNLGPVSAMTPWAPVLCQAPGWAPPRTVDRKGPVTAHKDLPFLLSVDKGRGAAGVPYLQEALTVHPVHPLFHLPSGHS